MNAVIFGKFPGFGDFLAHGLSPAGARALEGWLESVLPDVKENFGDNWPAIWDSAPVLRFWIGPSILDMPLMGLFVPSRDKVGRRYPFIFGLSEIVTPPPLHVAHDEAVYDYLWSFVSGIQLPDDPLGGARALLDGFVPPKLVGVPWQTGQDGTLWGSRDDGDLPRLFREANQTDADKAQMLRSHWWHGDKPVRSAGWLAANGLPDAGAMQWLLADRVKAPEKQVPITDESDDGKASDD